MNVNRTLSHRRCGLDLMDAIYERRAVRAYSTRAVEEDVLRAVIDAAIQAPSAVNRQPWAFVIVQDPARLRRISERSKQLALLRAVPGSPLWEHRAAFHDPSHSVFYDAGTLIVICATPGDWHVDEDCCLAAQNLMLAAHGLGLATCPIGLAREALGEPETKDELGVPSEASVVFPVIIGYPREQPDAPPRNEPRIFGWK